MFRAARQDYRQFLVADSPNPNVLTAAISAGAAVVALLVNASGFSTLGDRINSLERRIEVIGRDLKDFFKAQADFDKRLSRIEDKLNLPPN